MAFPCSPNALILLGILTSITNFMKCLTKWVNHLVHLNEMLNCLSSLEHIFQNGLVSRTDLMLDLSLLDNWMLEVLFKNGKPDLPREGQVIWESFNCRNQEVWAEN